MLEDLPEKLTGEQVRCILHIGKKKCAWMLNNGFIKCQNSGKKSRKYTVLKEDLLAFIDDSAKHPEKYVTPYAAFSTAKEVKNKKRKRQKAGFPTSLPDDFRPWLEQEFEKKSDALTVAQVIKITGYVKNTVDQWIRKGWLKSVQAQSGQIVPKVWLIDFYCGYGYSIGKMSDKHVRLMRRFFKGKIET